MIPVFVIQQQSDARHGEKHDSLDQRWASLLLSAQILPILLPNNIQLVESYLQQPLAQGVLFSGGGEHQVENPDPRSQVEQKLLDWAKQHNKPVLGVCRGMQVLLLQAGASLQPVKGHISKQQSICFQGLLQQVNSYHELGCFDVPDCFQVLAKAQDGVVKAIQHQQLPWLGIMWHPERLSPQRSEDINMIRQLFKTGKVPCKL